MVSPLDYVESACSLSRKGVFVGGRRKAHEFRVYGMRIYGVFSYVCVCVCVCVCVFQTKRTQRSEFLGVSLTHLSEWLCVWPLLLSDSDDDIDEPSVVLEPFFGSSSERLFGFFCFGLFGSLVPDLSSAGEGAVYFAHGYAPVAGFVSRNGKLRVLKRRSYVSRKDAQRRNGVTPQKEGDRFSLEDGGTSECATGALRAQHGRDQRAPVLTGDSLSSLHLSSSLFFPHTPGTLPPPTHTSKTPNPPP